MRKKQSFSKKSGRRYRINRVILLSLFSAAIAFADSKNIVTDIESYFSNLNVALSTFGQEVTRLGAKRAKEPLEKMVLDYPGIEFIIWLNSKGVVVNEAVRKGKPGKPHRNLSRQKWFEKIVNLKPYYSHVKTRKGDHQLFWCKPIRIRKSGKYRSGGAIVVRIDLKRSFEAAAKNIPVPFRVLQKEETLFSHSWETSFDSEAAPLTIEGISDLQLNVKKKKPVVKSPPPESAPESANNKKNFSLLSNTTLIVVGPIVIVLIILVGFIVKVVVKKRQEALIRLIEGDEPFVEPESSFGKKKGGELIEDVKGAEETLPKKKKEISPIKTVSSIPPKEKPKAVLKPKEKASEEAAETTAKEEDAKEEAAESKKGEEIIAENGEKLAEPEKVQVAEEKKEVKLETPTAPDEHYIMDFVPPETQILQPDFVERIKDIKPGQETDETVAAEEEQETIPPNLMEKVETLLKKHVHSVLEERAKQIEEDVLNRVRDELAGRTED